MRANTLVGNSMARAGPSSGSDDASFNPLHRNQECSEALPTLHLLQLPLGVPCPPLSSEVSGRQAGWGYQAPAMLLTVTPDEGVYHRLLEVPL